MLNIRKHVGDMFFLGSQSTQSLGEFTGEKGDLFSDMDMEEIPKMELDPTCERWCI
jgi:hypothetical protein